MARIQRQFASERPSALPAIARGGAGTADATGRALEALGQRGADITFQFAEREQEARRAADLSNAMSTALEDLGNAQLEEARNPDFRGSAERFAQTTREVRERLMQNLDNATAFRFASSFDRMAALRTVDVRRNAFRREVDASVANMVDTNNQLLTTALNAGSEQERGAALDEARANIGRMREAGFISARGAQEEEARVLGGFDAARAGRLIDSNPSAAIAALGDTERFTNLDPLRRERLLSEARRAQRARAAEARRELRREATDWAAVTRRGDTFAGEAALFERARRLDPELHAELVRQQAAIAETHEFRLSAPAEQAAALRDLSGRDELTRLESDTLAEMRTIHAQTVEAIDEDPARHVMRTDPEVRRNFERASANPQDRAALSAAVDSSLAAQAALGVPEHRRRALPGAVATRLVERYTSLEGGRARLEYLEGLSAAYGDAWPAVHRQLSAAGLPAGARVLGGMTGPRQRPAAVRLAATQAAGRQTVRGNLAGTDARDIDEDIDTLGEAFFRSLANDPETLALYREQIQLQAYQYRLEGRSTADAARQAYEDLVGGEFEIREGVRIPRRIGRQATDIGAIDNALQSMIEPGILRAAGVDTSPRQVISTTPGLTQEEAGAEYLRSVVRDHRWMTTPDGEGVILIDGAGRPVLLDNGRLFRISFAALNRLAGDVNRLRSQARSATAAGAFPIRGTPSSRPFGVPEDDRQREVLEASEAALVREIRGPAREDPE